MFAVAIELADPTARAAYLDRACAGTEALRKEVQSLLAAHERGEGFLNTSAMTETLAMLPPPEQPGQRIGRYRLLERIGEGGFGVVWMAEQEEPVRRRVALKVIKLGMDTREVVARFEAERQALALMDHPHIARVFDGGATEAGRPFFVMELVAGIPITESCDRRCLSLRDRLDLFIEVCAGVQHAHQKGLIHRDLKPSNVLVSESDGRRVPKIIDFGIAKAIYPLVGSSALITQAAQWVGTPDYMSPEQAGFGSLDVDTRSDVYSLGVLLYELITARRPFSQGDPGIEGPEELRRAIYERDPLKPSTRLAHLNSAALATVAQSRRTDAGPLIQKTRGELDWIVMKCLAKDRTQRYHTVNGLAVDVRRALNHEPVFAGPPSVTYRLRKLVRRNRALFASLGTVLLILLSALAATVFLLGREREARGRAVTAEKAESRQRDQADERLRQAYLMQARATRWSGRPGRRFDALEALGKAAALQPSLELRNEAIAAMALVDVRILRQQSWAVDPPTLVSSPDARFYSIHEGRGDLSIRRMSDDAVLHTLKGFGATPWVVVFSPDNRYLAVKYDQNNVVNLWVWDLTTSEVVLKVPDGIHHCAMAFTPDSQWLAAGTKDRAIRLYHLASGEVRPFGQAHSRPYFLSFNPQGTTLAASSIDNGMVVLLDRNTASITKWLPHQDAVRRIAWNPDGSMLATGCADAKVYLWSVLDGRRLDTLEAHEGPIGFLGFDPTGRFLSSVGGDGTTRFWEVGSKKPLIASPGVFVGWSAENLMTYQSMPMIGVGEFDPALELRTVTSTVRAADKLVAGPADELFLATMRDGLALYDATTARELAVLAGGPVGDAAWDGVSAILVSGNDGILTYPVTFESTPAERVCRVGPARLLCKTEPVVHFAFQRSTQTMAMLNEGGIALVDYRTGQRTLSLRGPEGTDTLAFSPDGRWLAAGNWQGRGVMVWDVPTGTVATNLEPQSVSVRVTFSPNGRWLVVAGRDAYRFYESETWRLVRQVARLSATAYPGGISFDPAGTTCAIMVSSREGRLIDVEHGTELATFHMPQEESFGAAYLTPGASTLVIASALGNRLGIWNLARIRGRLAAMNLDWTAPTTSAITTTALPWQVIGEGAARQGAGSIMSVRERVRPRVPYTDPRCLDLTAHYNALLNEAWQPGIAGNDLAEFPSGEHTYGGVRFDVRGLIQISGGGWLSAGGGYCPQQVNNIPVGRKAARMHFLHGCSWRVAEGTVVGYYTLRYADAQQIDLPIIYGQDLRDWWSPVEGEPNLATRASLAWTGTNRRAAIGKRSLRLFQSDWTNPRPDQEIVSINFSSTMTRCAPFLLGVTVE